MPIDHRTLAYGLQIRCQICDHLQQYSTYLHRNMVLCSCKDHFPIVRFLLIITKYLKFFYNLHCNSKKLLYAFRIVFKIYLPVKVAEILNPLNEVPESDLQ